MSYLVQHEPQSLRVRRITHHSDCGHPPATIAPMHGSGAAGAFHRAWQRFADCCLRETACFHDLGAQDTATDETSHQMTTPLDRRSCTFYERVGFGGAKAIGLLTGRPFLRRESENSRRFAFHGADAALAPRSTALSRPTRLTPTIA